MYLKNRCPTKAVQGKTPYEALHGETPRVDHFRVFGCDAYAHIPSDERGKLDTKARKCVFIGYGEETRLYDAEERKVLYSRDVQFNETVKYSKHGLPVVNKDYELTIDFQSDTDTET